SFFCKPRCSRFIRLFNSFCRRSEYSRASFRGRPFSFSSAIRCPVEEFQLFPVATRCARRSRDSLPICSGTRKTAREPRFVYSTRVEVDLGKLTVDAYHPASRPEMVARPHQPQAPAGGNTPWAPKRGEASRHSRLVGRILLPDRFWR